ncbi:MAG: peptidyl-prolyl cis-trans isomerase [Myxococcota bacterium]|nr:peptidyl-prolyl cis-trans isomerase [Myxococcota bacterium]
MMRQRASATLAFFFVAIPLVVFDRYFSSADGSVQEIVVTQDISDALKNDFQQTTGASPTAGELSRLERRWLLDELMIQRARALGLDRRDPIVRRRLLHKIRELAALGPPPDSGAVEAYYASHPEEFMIPERIDADIVAVPKGSAAEDLLAQLEAGTDPKTLGRPTSHGVRQRALTVDHLKDRLGMDSPQQVLSLPLQAWSIVNSRSGQMIFRVVRRQGATLATVESVSARIIDRLMSERRKQRIEAYESELEQQWLSR